MNIRIVADRFAAAGPALSRDLATGEIVRVSFRSRLVSGEGRAEGLPGTATHAAVPIDSGPIGTEGWFEAHAAAEGTGGDRTQVAGGELAERVAAAANGASGGTRALSVSPAGLDGRTIARQIAPSLREVGFVPVRADLDGFELLARALAHRHVGLIVYAGTDMSVVRIWLRELTCRSPRGHLIVYLDEEPGGPADGGVTQVRERMPQWASGQDGRPFDRADETRFRRAASLARRSRHAGAARWFRAAMEAARRRGDDAGHSAACAQLVDVLVGRGEWQAATRLTRRTLRALNDEAAQVQVVARLVRLLIALVDLDQADAVLSGWLAVRWSDRAYRQTLVRAEVELRFWQGRFDECLAAAAPLAFDEDALFVTGLVAWIRRDPAALAGATASLAAERGGHAAWQQDVLALLSAGLAADPDGAASRGAGLARALGASAGSRVGPLGRAAAADALVAAGQEGDARRLIAGDRAGDRASPLDRQLTAWMAAKIGGDVGRASGCCRALGRAGVGVVRQWRWGERDMYLIQSIPRVLELIHEAEDEQAVLVAACSWLRRDCGVDAAAFLDAHGRVVASEGWTTGDCRRLVEDAASSDEGGTSVRGDGRRLCRVHVRYAGGTTGSVVVLGAAERGCALREAAETAAALAAPALAGRVASLAAQGIGVTRIPEILGCSPAMVALRETVVRIAPTPFSVLIEGESGTGKELVARAIHRLSPRRDRCFAAVNCAALSDELVESELFGHARGAFTGAVGPRTGLFEEAHGGSLFLDEVGELSARTQAKLLRVLQEREVRRVGENAARPIDIRVIAATNRMLAEMVRHGLFREDLLFRLAVVRVRLPPLRERIEDVPLIAGACWRALAAEAGTRALLGADAVARLTRHRWPGNVRELQNVIAALVVMAPRRGCITARHVSQVLVERGDEVGERPLHHVRAECERQAVAAALTRHGGRRAAAARALGLSRQGLTKVMKRLGLTPVPPESVVA